MAEAAAAPLRGDHGHSPHRLRHRDFRWLATSIQRCEGKTWTAFLLCLAAAGFQQAAIDPHLDDVQLFLWQRILIGRHDRRVVVGHHLVQPTAFGIAVVNDFAAAATFHQGGKAIDRQTALGIVGVVALETVLAKNRLHMLGVIDLWLVFGRLFLSLRSERQSKQRDNRSKRIDTSLKIFSVRCSTPCRKLNG